MHSLSLFAFLRLCPFYPFTPKFILTFFHPLQLSDIHLLVHPVTFFLLSHTLSVSTLFVSSQIHFNVFSSVATYDFSPGLERVRLRYTGVSLYYLFFPGLSSTAFSTTVSRLHLQQRTEKIIRRSCKEANLSIRMQAIQVRALWW